MTDRTFTAFMGADIIASGPEAEVAAAVRELGAAASIGVYDDATGRPVDIAQADAPAASSEIRGPGRPKLGVVAREVTLLPRHWEWLATQPGGASAALRRMVDAARKEDGATPLRAAQEAAYRFMHDMAGDLPGYEEAIRALFGGDREAMAREIAGWPADVRGYALRLAEPSFA